MMGWHWGAGMGLWTWLFALLIIAGLVALVIAVVRGASGGARGGDGRSSAEQILAERFARGEIDEEEYQRRLRALRGP